MEFPLYYQLEEGGATDTSVVPSFSCSLPHCFIDQVQVLTFSTHRYQELIRVLHRTITVLRLTLKTLSAAPAPPSSWPLQQCWCLRTLHYLGSSTVALQKSVFFPVSVNCLLTTAANVPFTVLMPSLSVTLDKSLWRMVPTGITSDAKTSEELTFRVSSSNGATLDGLHWWAVRLLWSSYSDSNTPRAHFCLMRDCSMKYILFQWVCMSGWSLLLAGWTVPECLPGRSRLRQNV